MQTCRLQTKSLHLFRSDTETACRDFGFQQSVAEARVVCRLERRRGGTSRLEDAMIGHYRPFGIACGGERSKAIAAKQIAGSRPRAKVPGDSNIFNLNRCLH